MYNANLINDTHVFFITDSRNEVFLTVYFA